MVRYGMAFTQSNTVLNEYSIILVRYWYGTVWYRPVDYVVVEYNTLRYGMVWY